MKEDACNLQSGVKDNTEQGLVSIVVAVYNGEQFLEQTLNSILGQTYKNFELIVIDGASTDTTPSILERYNDQITYWVSEPDNGVYDAWNKALKVAKGDWIAFVGADDILLPDALENYMHLIESSKSTDIEFVSSILQIVTENLSPLRCYGSAWRWDKFKEYMNVGHVGALHHRSLFKKYGCYDTTYRIAADYEFLLRAKGSLKAAFLDQVTVKMRAGGLSHYNVNVLKEAYRAKVHTAELPATLSKWQYAIAVLKFYVRRLIRGL